MFGFGAASFARIAEEMGACGLRVEKPAEIGPAIQEALAADRPAVVEVMTDVNCPAPEPWAP
jgi:acetolactate synthase-1/2/3 large subunit